MPLAFRTRRLFVPLLGLAMMFGVGATSPAREAPSPPADPVILPDATPEADPSKAALEERVRQLEAMVKQLSEQMRNVQSAPGSSNGPAAPDTPSNGNASTPSGMGGVGAPGQSLPPNPPPNPRFDSPATLESKKGNVKFGPGFEIRTDDDEFILQFHNLTQVEYRGYQQGGQTSTKSTFDMPRQWFMFSGRAGRQFGYFVSIANGFDNLSMLDAFIDYEVDPRFKLRVGRMKTPFTYEFLVEPVQGMVVPERSVFFNNFGQNRDIGIMANGRLFDKRVDYAVGIWNGTRNGYLSNDNGKKVSAFVNWHPFGKEEGSILENLNVGGSVYAGDNQQAAAPLTLRTIVPVVGNPVLGVPFLGLNSNVRETGFAAFWDLHLAWFYQQWAFIGEWASGFQTYSQAAPIGAYQARTRVPVGSFYTQISYLLTGETRSSIGLVKPKSPFELRKGHYGTGAWEPFFRFEYLDIGSEVFTAGFADANEWANRMYMTHAGVDWHLTQYMKIYFDWNHAVFNQPVIFAPGRRQLTSDMFLLRFQLYF